MIRQSTLLVLASTIALAAVTTLAADQRPNTKSAADWPQWRGPRRDGISPDTGLLNSWPKEGPPLVWKAGGLGRGFSSLAIADGRIITMGDLADGQYVLALSQADGKPVWKTRIGDVWEPQGYAGPRCTPTIDGPRIYALGPHGDLVCLEAASGKELWHRKLAADFGGRMHSGWGFSESPLVDGDRLICTPGGAEAAIVALDKKSGSEIWRAAVPALGDKGGDGAAYASIVIGNGGGRKQYIQLMGRGVVSVDAENGKFLWGYNRVANPTANIPTPVVMGDYVFCSSGYQTGAALLKLSPDGDGVRAEEVYFLDAKTFQNHHGGMIVLGDYLYTGHGHNAGAPTCLAWKTGDVAWRHNRGPGTGSAAVAYADGNLYFRFENGVMALIGATPEGYQEKGSFQIPDVGNPSWSHPVVIGGRLYLREQDALLVYDVKQK